MLGNVARVTNRRGTAPSLSGDEWALLTGIDNSLGSLKYKIAFFEASDEAYARTLSQFIISSAPGAPIDPSSPNDSEIEAARAMIAKEVSGVSKSSITTFCKGDEWRKLLQEAPSGGGSTPPDVPPPAVQVGSKLANIPVAVQGASGPIAKIVKQATVIAPPDSDGEVLIADEGGEEYLVSGVTVDGYCVPDTLPLPLPGLSAEIIKILKCMPLSSSVGLAPDAVDAYEFMHMARTCGCSQSVGEQLEVFTPQTPQFETVALLLMLELQSKLKGKVLGTTWPTTPAELGTALKERARSGTFVQLDHAITVEESPRLQVTAAEKADHPLSAALKSRASSTSEWESFLKESVELSEPAEARRRLVRASTLRMTGALERLLASLVKDGTVTPEALSAGRVALSGDDLVAKLLDWDARRGEASAAGASSVTVGGGPSPAISINMPLPPDTQGTEEDRVARGALRDAGKRLLADPAAWERLQQMQLLATAKDFVALELLKSKESNHDVKLLLSSDVADVPAALAGVITDGYINVIRAVRMGLDARLLFALFPDKATHPERVKLAVRYVRVGRLSKCRLLHLLDKEDGGTKDKPLMQLDRMHNSSDLAFKDALSLVRDIITMVSPAQTTEAMHFFRTMLHLCGEYREDGATWGMLGTYLKEVIAVVESPAVDFSNGLGGGSVLFKLDSQVFDRRAEARYTLDKVLRAHKDAALAAGSARQPVKPTTQRSPSTPTGPLSQVSPPPPPGQLTPDEWKVRCDKLAAGCPDADGKKPCRSWFIKGTCPRGDKCFAHHKGAAGSFK